MNLQLSDLATVGLLVVLEGLLSADNALVVAVMILGLPRQRAEKGAPLRAAGRLCLSDCRHAAGGLSDPLAWVKLLGGLYLLYLTYQHFFQSGDAEQRSKPRPAKPWLGLSALWGTILKVELVNVAFSVDSILVAVAMSSKTWVVLAGGLIGIVAMRVVISQLLAIVRRYPTLVDGAFIIIALVGTKLLLDTPMRWRGSTSKPPKWISLLVIAVTFLIAYWQARRKRTRRRDTEVMRSTIAERRCCSISDSQ